MPETVAIQVKDGETLEVPEEDAKFVHNQYDRHTLTRQDDIELMRALRLALGTSPPPPIPYGDDEESIASKKLREWRAAQPTKENQ